MSRVSRTARYFPVGVFILVLAIPVWGQPFVEYRTVDGTNNNLTHPEWGSVAVQLLRQVPPDYADGISEPSGQDRPGAREISNVVVAQPGPTADTPGPSNMFWLWGQFLDHDIDLTEAHVDDDGVCLEPFAIGVPVCDPFFDPFCTGTQEIDLCRSIFDPTTGTYVPRQQINEITAYIDGSNIYGSDDLRAGTLRTLDGTGRLKVTPPGLVRGRDLLPYNVYGLPNASLPGQDPTTLFLAGDVRANENVALIAMHTLWVREHNYWAKKIDARYPFLDGDGIFQFARAIVGAELQAITYNEFLPVLLGNDGLGAYSGYDANLDAGIVNSFSTAAFRFGHSMLTTNLFRLRPNLTPIPEGNIEVRDAFFAPQEIGFTSVAPLLRGAAIQRANDVDPFVVDDVRNFLFGPPGSGGFDLASLNIQRGRDHGHPSYNDVRVAFGLPPKPDIDSMTDNFLIRARLYAAYGSVEKIDPWVGGLAEKPLSDGLVGELWRRLFKHQFHRLRAGDRFWYEAWFPAKWVDFIEKQTLATVIRRNTDVGSEIPDNPFIAY